jgi:hypothetical protein
MKLSSPRSCEKLKVGRTPVRLDFLSARRLVSPDMADAELLKLCGRIIMITIMLLLCIFLLSCDYKFDLEKHHYCTWWFATVALVSWFVHTMAWM